MRRISLDQIQPGMKLARAIYGAEGQLLLNTGVEIKPHYVKYLYYLGIKYIYVEDSRLQDVEVKDIIAERTRQEVRILLKEIMRKNGIGQRPGKPIHLGDIRLVATITKIVDELLENKDVVVNLADIRSIDEYIFYHSVNTCLLSLLTAIKLGYSEAKLRQIAPGFLLHDLGNISIPDSILKKAGQLTTEEMEIVRKHPIYGYELFKKSPLFSASAGQIIYQHHERWQGQGYPWGLKGDSIHQPAQILAIADTYDALTSERPYRSAYLPHQALEILTALGEEYFNLQILRTFLSFIAAYPVGTQVLLSNGDSGLVISNTPNFPTRPKVRVLYQGENFAPHPAPYEVDLTDTLDLVVTKVIN